MILGFKHDMLLALVGLRCQVWSVPQRRPIDTGIGGESALVRHQIPTRNLTREPSSLEYHTSGYSRPIQQSN